MDWYTPLIPIVLGLGRALLGWFENAIRDNRISDFEWKQLVNTCARFVTMAILLYVPMEFGGVDNAEWISSAVTVGLDYILHAVKKLKTHRM